MRGALSASMTISMVAAMGLLAPAAASAASPEQHAASSSFMVQGGFATAGATALTTATATLGQAGDLLVIWVKSRFVPATPEPIQVTSISASGSGAVGNLVNAIQYDTVDHPSNDDEIWFAPITTAGGVTLTFHWSGDSSKDFNEYSTQEFLPSSPSVFSLDTKGTYEVSSASSTMTFPPLTPIGAGEVYAGYDSNNSSGSYGSPTTSGYFYKNSADNDAIIYDPNVSNAPQSPITTASATSPNQSSIGVLIIGTPIHTVTFNANLGSGSMSPEVASAPTALTTNTFTRTYYSFAGWNTTADGSGTAYADAATYPFSADTILYAQWTPNNHTVSFNANLGSGTMSPQVTNAPAALTWDAFTRTYYTFAGWNTAANGLGTAYVNGATYPFSADVTLYAQWTPNNHTVTFDANLGSGTMNSQVTNAPAALTSDAFTRTYYSFAGWNTAANGLGTAYADGATYSFSADTTLYAQWTPNDHTVTFNGNQATSGSMSIEVTNVPTALRAETFVNNHHTFAGWNTAANGSDTAFANGAMYSFSANVTLYAQWTPVPHAKRVVGYAIVDKTRSVTIVGSGFTNRSKVSSNEAGATVQVVRLSPTRIKVVLAEGTGAKIGAYTFLIRTPSRATCRVNYVVKI
jgi:uncharacterized repeat protein (TIGR02543 family)